MLGFMIWYGSTTSCPTQLSVATSTSPTSVVGDDVGRVRLTAVLHHENLRVGHVINQRVVSYKPLPLHDGVHLKNQS